MKVVIEEYLLRDKEVQFFVKKRVSFLRKKEYNFVNHSVLIAQERGIAFSITVYLMHKEGVGTFLPKSISSTIKEVCYLLSQCITCIVTDVILFLSKRIYCYIKWYYFANQRVQEVL